MLRRYFFVAKGQIKPKAVWARRRFSQKMNKRICFVCREKQKSKQNKFIPSFFGRIYGASICFWFYLTFILDQLKWQTKKRQALPAKLCQTKPTNERISKNDTQGSHESSCSLLPPCDEIAKFLSRSLLLCLLAVACLGYVFLRRPLDLLFYGMALICFLCPLVVISAVLQSSRLPALHSNLMPFRIGI